MDAAPVSNNVPPITAEIVLRAYAAGMFPMAEDADDPSLFWVEPKRRGIIPLDDFHISRRLARTIRSGRFSIATDTDFYGVIDGCAAARPGNERTWINSRIREIYGDLFNIGQCHTVEVYESGHLVGGLYGVTLGAAFFGESMFHTARDASKVALAHLVALLKTNGYTLLDTQFLTDHLSQFGAIEISRRSYLKHLDAALQKIARWPASPHTGVEAVALLHPPIISTKP